MSSSTLDSSLRAGTVTVEDLVERVEAGQVRIPKFQRPLRWRAANVRDLFDSIWNNYPIGTLLLWKREGPEEELSLGRLRVALAARSDAMYVVDGQQRIAALANVLLHSGPTRSSHDIWALWFDLHNDKVLTGSELQGADAPGAACIPLNVVLDAVRLQTWCSEQGLVGDPELFRKALLLGKRIRQFVIPAYFVETDEELVLQRIFTRLNTAGQAMKQHEVFTALNYRVDRSSPMELAMRCFGDANMGVGVSEDLLLQCIRAGQGEDLSAKLAVEGQLVGDPDSSIRFVGALSLALEFIRDELGIVHHRLLPARWPLLTLVRFFGLHPTVDARTLELLRRWFWRGIVSRRSVDMNNPRLHWMYEHVSEDLAETLTCLLLDADEPTDERIEAFLAGMLGPPDRSASAVEVRVGIVILASLHPVNVDTGDEIDVSQLIDMAGAVAYGRAPAIAGSNRWRLLHPRVPQLVEKLQYAPAAVARSHAWVSVDPNGDERLSALRSLFGERLRAWCGQGQSDHLPLALAFSGLGEE